LAYIGLLAYRFAIADRTGRHLRQVFGYYLPATLIDRMAAAHHRPMLGGEVRELTVWFSDIQGFTELAEGLSPSDLVSLLNAYLAQLTDIIEEYGGFVDKYMGDGVVAVFGAPIEDPDHAHHAVQAARACQDRLVARETVSNILGGRHLKTRIGINTGQMLVGNIGSRRRMNYTVMGDAVNLAARLENANKLYGTSVLVSEATKRACGAAFVFREVDCVRVIGRHSPVRIFEPLTSAQALDAEHQSLTQRFAVALSDYRARRFEDAAAAFAALASTDYVSASFALRAAEFAASPPPADWDAITDLEQK
jgi:class 3 adenylate cyclase